MGSALSSFGPGATVWTTNVVGAGIDTKYSYDPGAWLITEVALSSSGRAYFGVMSTSPANDFDYNDQLLEVHGPGTGHILVSRSFDPVFGDVHARGLDVQVFGAQHYVANIYHRDEVAYTAYVDSDNGTFQNVYWTSGPNYGGWPAGAAGNAAGDLLVTGANGVDLRRIDASKATLYTRPLGAYTEVQAGAAGDAYLDGKLITASLDLGCGPLSGLDSSFAARIDPAGQCVWSRAIPPVTGAPFSPSTDASFLLGGARDYLTGTFQGTVDLGCGPLTSAAGKSKYVAALDAAGACLWSENLGSLSPTLLPSGDLLLAGSFSGTLDVGCGPVTSSPGGSYRVARIDDAGVCLWDQALAVPSAVIGVSSSGEIAVAAAFAGTVDLGTGPLTSTGVSDLGLVRLDGSTGAAVWSTHVGGVGATLGAGAVHVDAGGGVLATGTISGTADLGGGPLTGGFSLRLDSAGAFRWQRALAGKAAYDACGATTTVTLTGTCDACGSYKTPTFTVERIAP